MEGFYYSLKRYRPVCYSNKGAPSFLIIRQRPLASLPCILFVDALLLLVIVLQWLDGPNSNDQEFNNIAKNVNILVLILIDAFYLLTILLNPGIKAKPDMELIGDHYSFCNRCQREVNKDMSHCIECETCVEDLDHHCSFFGKCIAGGQRFAFYGFITFMFVGFICLLGSLAVLLSPS